MRSYRCRALLGAALLALATSAVYADESTPSPDEPASPPQDAPPTPEDSIPEFYGPTSVSSELEAASTQLLDALGPWYGWKKQVLEETGLDFGVSYATLVQRASRSGASGERDAGGGIFRFYGTWTLIGRDTENEGALVFRVEQRHKLGTDLAPTELGRDAGSAVATGRTFGDFQWGATLAYWRQYVYDGRVVLVAGRVDPTDYFDMYALGSSQTHFVNGAFGTMPTVDAPSFGFGAAAGAMLADDLYTIVGFSDATGSATQSRWSEVRDDNEWFQHAEIGWTTSKERIATDNVHLAYWRMDRRDEPDLAHNWGLNFSASLEDESGLSPFLRAGYASGDTAPLDRVVTIGVGQRIADDNLLGVGLSWGRPSDSDLDEQETLEVFYRFQLAENVHVTPDVQLIRDPSLDRDESTLWVVGLRVRITF